LHTKSLIDVPQVSQKSQSLKKVTYSLLVNFMSTRKYDHSDMMEHRESKMVESWSN